MIKNIARLHAAIVAAGVTIDGVDSNGSVTPVFAQAAAQPTINAFDDSPAATAAFVKQSAKAAAADTISETGDSQTAHALRAIVLLILDEFNAHALKMNAILDAVDGAASLAALKTAVAAIADYPQRTKAQLLTAMQNKIQAGDTD